MIRGTLLVAAISAISLSTLSAGAQMALTGAGSTFAYPLYSSWASEYHKLHPNVQINYQSIGSGGGIRQVIAGTVDFGGTDGPMNDTQLGDARTHRGTDVLHFPVALGADVPTYNVPGVSGELNFTQDALAGIFLGKITRWNDPEIQKANPGLKLPGNDIVVIHRSDGSGTTYVWVDYLAKISPEWKSKVGVGTSVNWPVGLGGKGNEGVSGLVRQTANAIGYVELIYAIQNHMPYGKVRNHSGAFVKADLNSVTAAAASTVKNMPADFRVSITDALGKDVYPVSSFTWMLVPKSFQDKTKGEALKAFLVWGLTDGQKLLAPLSYSNVPTSIVAKEMQAIKQLQY
jgi:phosphate transport system substrate-binding protein